MNAAEWAVTDTVDDAARGIYMRHYSSWKRAAHARNPRFVGPGEAMVLVLPDYRALFVWRRSEFRLDEQEGVECTVFRNESPLCSSDLIRLADEMAWRRWPGERHFTYVDPKSIRSNNPGYCFIQAGWKRLKHKSTRGFRILEIHAPSKG